MSLSSDSEQKITGLFIIGLNGGEGENYHGECDVCIAKNWWGQSMRTLTSAIIKRQQ